MAPKTIRKDATDSAGKPIVGPDGKPAKKSVVIGFTAVSVFDVSQTDGEPLPDGESMTTDFLAEEPPPGFQEDLTAAITESGYSVSYDDIPGGARGFTDPHGKRVVIRSGMSEANQGRIPVNVATPEGNQGLSDGWQGTSGTGAADCAA